MPRFPKTNSGRVRKSSKKNVKVMVNPTYWEVLQGTCFPIFPAPNKILMGIKHTYIITMAKVNVKCQIHYKPMQYYISSSKRNWMKRYCIYKLQIIFQLKFNFTKLECASSSQFLFWINIIEILMHCYAVIFVIKLIARIT